MELLLVRHARPEVVLAPAHPATAEPADPPLTDEGNAQARLLAKALAAGLFGTVTAVVSSTMRRAVETAAPAAEALGVVAETDERLVELDHGWTTYGLPVDAYPTRQAAWAAINGGTWGTDTFEPAAFRRRVRDGIEAVVRRHADATVAVVCHGGVINVYLAEVLGVDATMFFAPSHCSVSRVLVEPGYREVLSMNETLHLRV